MKTKKNKLIISFGSQATGRANAMSDFDIAVLYDKKLTLTQMTQISHRLAKKLKINEDKIDIVDLRESSPLLQYEVAQNGKLVNGTEFDFIRFKIRAWKVYLDTTKFRQLREQMIKKYV